jgi:Transposase IS116/IS110/IS902 family
VARRHHAPPRYGWVARPTARLISGLLSQIAHCDSARKLGDDARCSSRLSRKIAREVLYAQRWEAPAEFGPVWAFKPLVATAAPTTTARPAVSTAHAGSLLVTAGQNIERLRSEASFAALCGAGPIPVSTGRTDRHRLNHGGDRDANRALHMIAVCRLRYCERTRAYAERRTAEGKTKTEIIRCLKRYIAREIYHALVADLLPATHPRRRPDPIVSITCDAGTIGRTVSPT